MEEKEEDEEEEEEGEAKEGTIEEEEEGEDVAEGINGLGIFPRGIRDQIVLRVGFVAWEVASLVAEDAADEEDEEEEKAKDKRDGEPGRPMRMTVPFEEAESGRGGTRQSGDEGGLSSSVARGSRAGLIRRPVRPPDGRRVRAGAVAGWGVGAVRTQRSGAEYWYASRSSTRGGARRESRAWNWPRQTW